jgi:far upstream element-binding protein
VAKEMIYSIIRDSGMRGAAAPGGESRGRDSGRGTAPPPLPKEGEESSQIMVPDRTVGLIIGRHGETIRDLQERSGCHINIVSENKSVNGLRPVNLIGPPAAARHAKELILEIVESDSRNGNNPAAGRAPRGESFGGGGGGGEKINDSIYVPSDAVGMIIGKGGETIREMQNMTGCKINVNQSSGPGEVEREIGLVGTRDSIARAKRAIEEKVDAAVRRGRS